MGLQQRRALSARHAAELCTEIEPLVGTEAEGRIRDVQSLPPRDVILGVETRSGLMRLRLSADAEAPRLHLVSERVPGHKGPLGPFFRALEQELHGARVLRLAPVGKDRIVRLECSTPAGPRSLYLELVGRHANLVLAGPDERVLALLVPPPEKPGTRPRLVLGEPWRAPPGQPPAEEGPPLAEAFAPAPPEDLGPAPLSRSVELVLGTLAREKRRAELASELLQRLKRRAKTLERTLLGIAERRRAASAAERLRQDGELLKAAQQRLARGQVEVELDDWFDPAGRKRRIELDPKLSPRENVERLFKRARKLAADAASAEADEELAHETQRRLEELAALAERPDADCEALDREAVQAGLLAARQEPNAKKPRAEPAARLPYRRFQAQSGAEVLVGRSARDNDVLSLKIGRGNDVWLHTQDSPGSHVVLRIERGQEPDPDDVLDAAHLALYYSPLRGATRAQIHVARCKDVKKPKGYPPGMVNLAGGRTLSLRVEPERLERLLDTRP